MRSSTEIRQAYEAAKTQAARTNPGTRAWRRIRGILDALELVLEVGGCRRLNLLDIGARYFELPERAKSRKPADAA